MTRILSRLRRGTVQVVDEAFATNKITQTKGNGVVEMCRGRKLAEELTELFKHLITFVKNKMLDVCWDEYLVPCQGVETTWRGDDDVRTFRLILQNLRILRDRRTAVEHDDSNVWHVLCKTNVLVTYLESQFPGVAENKD